MSLPESAFLGGGFSSVSSRSSSSSDCSLSPAAGAFSAMLSAFVGSVINGLTSGWLVAFMTGWIAWFALFRVLVGGLYMLNRSVRDSWGPGMTGKTEVASTGTEDSSYLMADHNGHHVGSEEPYGRTMPKSTSRYGCFGRIWPSPAVVRGLVPYAGGPTAAAKSQAARALTHVDREVTALGWFSWIYGAIYSPIAQIIWVAANVSRDDNGLTKIVKGLTIAITALPLCLDCRVRYADSLKYGRVAFNLTHSLSCLLQGLICALLLVRGVIDTSAANSGFPWPLVVIYPIFSLIWMFGSYALIPMLDGSWRGAGKSHWAGYIFDVGMGAFAGIFLAAPAFALYQNAEFDKLVSGDSSSTMDNIADYLACESEVWRKFAAVAP